MLQARNTMLHLILTAVCLLQIQGTYSRYTCNRCISRSYPSCSPVYRNVFQENSFCYNRPRETIVTFNHNPRNCLRPCECKKLNASLPDVAESPSFTPFLSTTCNEEKTSPQPPPSEEKENPSSNPIPITPPGTEKPLTQPRPTNTLPETPTSTPMIPMEDGTIPPSSSNINPIGIEGDTPMGDSKMIGDTSNQIQMPMFFDESRCSSCPMDFMNLQGETQSPCSMCMFPSSLCGEISPSSCMQMEPLNMEDGIAEPSQTTSNPMPMTNQGQKNSMANPIPMDENTQPPVPPSISPSDKKIEPPPSPLPIDTTSDPKPTEEEGNPLSPSTPTDFGNIEGEMFIPKPETKEIEEGSDISYTMPIEEEMPSNQMFNNPMPMEGEPSQPTPSPTDQIDMDSDNSAPNFMPLEKEIQIPQASPIIPTKPQGAENVPPSPQQMETVSMEEVTSSPLPSTPVGMNEGVSEFVSLPFSMCSKCTRGQTPLNPSPNDPRAIGQSQPTSPTDSAGTIREDFSPISMPIDSIGIGEESPDSFSMSSNPAFNGPLPMEGEIPQQTSFSTSPMKMTVGKPSLTIPHIGTNGGSQPGSIPLLPTGTFCGSPSSTVSTYINEPCYRPSQTPLVGSYNIPYRNRPTVAGCQCNVLSHGPRETFRPSANVVGHSSFCSQTSFSHIKPVYEEVIHHVPVIKNVVKNRVVETTHHIPVVEKLILHETRKIVRHIPVVQKVLRNVVECRTRHVPVLQHCARTVLEPYTEHVLHTEKITRPVIETLIKHVPMVFSQYKPVLQHRIRHVPVVETRCRPVIEETVTTVPVRRPIFKNIVEQKFRPIIGPCTSCSLQATPQGITYIPNNFHSCCKNTPQGITYIPNNFHSCCKNTPQGITYIPNNFHSCCKNIHQQSFS